MPIDQIQGAAVATSAPAPPTAKAKRRAPEFAALLVVLLALCVFFTIKSPYFLAWDNFLNIFAAVAVTGIVAAPATMLLIGGQFDLSVGSGAAFVGAIAAHFAGTDGLVVAVLLAIAGGLGLGALNGFLVTVVGVSGLITTLGTLAIFRGVAQLITDGQTLPINGFSALGTGRLFFNIPMSVAIFLVVAILFGLLLRYTTFGRGMYAIGANPVAARLAGIPASRAIFLSFLASGLFVALAGLVLLSQLGAAGPTAAQGLELSVVTAVILGGASLSGGRGTVVGTVIGLLIIGVLNNGLVLLNVSSFWQDVARGTLLILAVSFDQLRVRFNEA